MNAIRALIEEHWRASEAGDTTAEHAMYAHDAILDYPQFGDDTPSLSWDGDLEPGVSVRLPSLNYSIGGVTSGYGWQKSTDGTNWSTVESGSGAQYTVGLTDANYQLRVIVYGSKLGYGTYTATTTPVVIGPGTPIRELEAPATNATARVGQPVQLNTGEWSAEYGRVVGGPNRSLRSDAQRQADPGATSSTYTPVAINAGDELSTVVTVTEPGQLDVVVDTADLAIQSGSAPVPTQQQSAVCGKTALSVTTGTWNVSGLTFTYQWNDSSGNFPDLGQQSTYTLQPGELLANVSVTVTASRFGYDDGTDTVPN